MPNSKPVPIEGRLPYNPSVPAGELRKTVKRIVRERKARERSRGHPIVHPEHALQLPHIGGGLGRFDLP